MALEIKVPAVGESITEVTIGDWLKKEGDTVKLDDVLCTLDSDKASFELPAEADGVLHILAQAGDTLPIGAVICTIETVTSGATAPATPAPVAETPKPEPAPVVEPVAAPAPVATPTPVAASATVIEMKVPAVGESITEVTIAAWSKKDGDIVALDEVLCELESDKATFELPAEAAGTLRIVAQAGDTLAIGATIARIEVGATLSTPGSAPVPVSSPASSSAVPGSVSSQTANGQESYAAHYPSPAAAKILAEKGIEASAVQGSGIEGRITKEDAAKASSGQGQVVSPAPQPTPQVQQPAVSPAAKPAPVVAIPATNGQPPVAGSRTQRREKMTSLRRTIARRLVAVKNETAMLTTFNEVDMKPIMEMRTKFKDRFKEKHGVGLGFMSFFTKAVCVALREFPAVNAQIDGDQIVYNDFCDVSIAVSSERGLVVPVIRNAEQMNFQQIEKEIVRLAGLARDNKLTIEQMTGGTFTITNGGIFGSMLSTPIINAPQSAILGMHNIVERAVVVGGEIVVRPIMYVALSYDHRIIDGKESVSFLVRLKQLLEDPTRLLFDV